MHSSVLYTYLSSLATPSSHKISMRTAPIVLLLGLVALVYSREEPPGTGTFSAGRSSQKCNAIYQIPRTAQCSFVKDECQEYKLGIWNYLELYYCRFLLLGAAALVPMLLQLALLFVSVGLTASDYLCPNLYTISKLLSMSDNLAGLTLVALGNGAPDVLSTYTAMALGSSDLAVAELIGAAFFILTIVVGTMGMVHPFAVPKQAFLRDATFFALVVAIVASSLVGGILTLMHCMVLMGMYLIYVVVVICTHSIDTYRNRQLIRNQSARANYLDASEESIGVAMEQLPSIEELLAHSSPMEPMRPPLTAVGSTGPYGIHRLLKDLQRHSSSRVELAGEDQLRLVLAPVMGSPPAAAPTAPSATNARSDSSGSVNPALRYNNTLPPSLDLPWLQLLFPEFANFYQMAWLDKCTTACVAPMVLLLKLSVPVRDYSNILLLTAHSRLNNDPTYEVEDDLINYDSDKVLLCTQNSLANVFVTYVWCSQDKEYWPLVMPISLMVSCGLAVFTYSMYGQNIYRIKVLYHMLAIIGFVAAITWISIFATEIIAVLKMVSLVYNISDEILGVTVFALGNSVGDFIANFTIARMGMPLMAFSACFGGPMLTFSSMGLSGYVLMPATSSWRDLQTGFVLDATTSLKIVMAGLLFNAVFLCVWVPRNDWQVDKSIGSVSISIWVVTTTLCVLFEIA